MKLFVICGCYEGCSEGADKTNGLHVMKNLRARGHEVTLLGKLTTEIVLSLFINV